MSDCEVPGENLAAIADRLSDILLQETILLDALDLPEAGALLERKRKALASLQFELDHSDASSWLERQELAELRGSLSRLQDRAEANRAALERGLGVQLQLIDAIARAVPQARANQAPIYQPNGSKIPQRPPDAYAFLSQM